MVVIRTLTRTAPWLLAATITGATMLASSVSVTAQTPASQLQQRQQLGRILFADTRLSVNNTYSCASCHDPAQHFTDAKPLAIGALGQQLQRNTPTLLNVSQLASLGWTDDGVVDLATQHLGPLSTNRPVELGFTESMTSRLAQDQPLVSRLQLAFGASAHFSLHNITEALASYVATLRHDSPFDDYLHHDNRQALSAAAQRGLTLFTSQQLGCVNCHNGPLLGGGFRTAQQLLLPAIYEQRTVAAGQLQIRVPSLRAVAFTAPYMIDGRIPSLRLVLQFYQQDANSGVPAFQLSEQQTEDMLAFLRSL